MFRRGGNLEYIKRRMLVKDSRKGEKRRRERMLGKESEEGPEREERRGGMPII